MKWDSAAAAHLEAVVANLRQAGAVGLLEEYVAAVYRRNVDNYDTQLGDTLRSLGGTCAENLRELIVRACSGAESLWLARGVRASAPETSLQVEACGIRLLLMKGPPTPQRTPDWISSAFCWTQQDSAVRLRAATRNHEAYRPEHSDETHAQLALPISGATLSRNVEATADGAEPSGLTDVLLVWSGDLDTAATSGWLGFPTLGASNWFAVAPLWHHDLGGGSTLGRHQGGGGGDGDTYASRAEPVATVTLKPMGQPSHEAPDHHAGR